MLPALRPAHAGKLWGLCIVHRKHFLWDQNPVFYHLVLGLFPRYLLSKMVLSYNDMRDFGTIGLMIVFLMNSLH